MGFLEMLEAGMAMLLHPHSSESPSSKVMETWGFKVIRLEWDDHFGCPKLG